MASARARGAHDVAHPASARAACGRVPSLALRPTGSGHTGNQINYFDAVIHEKSTSQAVLRRMQLSLNATRRTPHGASRLMLAMSVWSVKPDVLRPGIVGIRGSMIIRLRPCIIMSAPPSPPALLGETGIWWAQLDVR